MMYLFDERIGLRMSLFTQLISATRP